MTIIIISILVVAVILISSSEQATKKNSSSSSTNSAGVISNQIKLNVSYPTNGTVVNTSSITVKGQTVPSGSVFVNDKELKADSQGNFSTTITLDEGENTISIAANDDQGNSSEVEMNVTYNP